MIWLALAAGTVLGLVLAHFFQGRRSDQEEADAQVDTHELLNGINAGVIAVDAGGRVEVINRAAIDMLGCKDRPHDLPLEQLGVGAELMAMLAGTNAEEVDSELALLADRFVQARATRLTEGQVFVLHEITDIKRLEVIRRDFVANVSHELRTPVSVIRANAETLLDGALDDQEMAPKFVGAIHRNAERISLLVSDLLDLARIEAGTTEFDPQDVLVSEIISRTVGSLSALAASKGIKIQDQTGGTARCWADEGALEQVLTNFIENAVKYGTQGGNIWVRAYETPGRVRIEIIDDGLGIDAKHRPRLFERFYRVDKGRSRADGGTGLGLSIVKHLVTSMGGQVGMEPNRPQGSVFWLTVPSLNR